MHGDGRSGFRKNERSAYNKYLRHMARLDCANLTREARHDED